MSTPLEHWYGPSHQQFQYFFDYKQQIVVERKQNESFDAYTKTNQRTRNCATYQYSHTMFCKRLYWVPIMAEHLTYDQIIAEPKIESISMYFQQKPQTFEEFVEQKYPCYKTFFPMRSCINRVEHLRMRSQMKLPYLLLTPPLLLILIQLLCPGS